MPDIYTYINILQLSFQSTADYSFLLHYKIKNQLRVTGTFPDWQDWPLQNLLHSTEHVGFSL